MATEHAAITDEQAALIESAPLFFVASVDPSLQDRPNGAGPVNLSPKGGVPLHIIDPSRVATWIMRVAVMRPRGLRLSMARLRSWSVRSTKLTPQSSGSSAMREHPVLKSRHWPTSCLVRLPMR